MDYVSNLICIFPIVLYYLPLKRLDHNRLRCKFSKSSLKLSPQLQDGTRRCTFRCSLGLRSQTRRFPPNHISDDPSRVQSFILGHLHYVKRIATNLLAVDVCEYRIRTVSVGRDVCSQTKKAAACFDTSSQPPK